MPYNPTYPPQDINDLIRWLADELTRINPDILVNQEYFSFAPLSVEPSRPTIGEIKWASGLTGSPGLGWDPGAGMGLYEFTDLGWSKLGGGNGGVVPTLHSSLQGLLEDDHPQYLTETRGDDRYYPKPIIDARRLNTLADVTTSLEQDGEVLTYDLGTLQWINKIPTGSSDQNPDGGFANSIYLQSQNIDGGFA